MKKIRLKDNKTFEYIVSIILVVFAALAFALAVKIFVSPKKLLSGGVSGITLIIGRLISKYGGGANETLFAGIFNFIINAPLLVLSWFKLNKKFTILTTIHVVVYSLLMAVLPDNLNELIFGDDPTFTLTSSGMLDAAIFAGAIAGSANAVAFIAGGSTAGVDIVSYYMSSKKQISVGRINAFVNGMIILLSIILFPEQGISHALYTLIYIFVNAMCIDSIYIRNRKTALSIVTNKGEEVSKFIMSKFYRGVTILDGKGAYTGNHKDFLYVVTTSFEAMLISKEVQKFDPDCFISVSSLEKVFGRFINKEVH